MGKNKELSIDDIPGLREFTKSPDYRQALNLPAKQTEMYELLAYGEYNINFLFRHPDTGEKKVLRVTTESQMHLENQIQYEANALQLLADSGRTPRLCFVKGGDRTLTKGALVMTYLPGRDLDYASPLELEETARCLADVHSVKIPKNSGLIQPDSPIRAILEECEAMLQTYTDSPLGKDSVKKRIRRLLDEGWRRVKEAKPYERYLCCCNTELNNTNFLVDEENHVMLVDWEKPLYSDPAQDLGHFLAPTTTFWKTDMIFGDDQIDAFMDAYLEAVADRFDTEGLRQRTREFTVITCLRGLTWCSMAWVQYQDAGKSLTNESTRVKLDAYLSDAFLTRIEEIYGIG